MLHIQQFDSLYTGKKDLCFWVYNKPLNRTTVIYTEHEWKERNLVSAGVNSPYCPFEYKGQDEA